MSIRLAAAVAMVVSAVAGSAAGQSTEEPIRLRFAAVVGTAPLQCGEQYADVGTTGSSIGVADFRFYVSRVRLLRADGSEQPVALTQDELWQMDDVALLDFENGTGRCVNGTEQTAQHRRPRSE